MNAREFVMKDIKNRFGDDVWPTNAHLSFDGWIAKMEEYAASRESRLSAVPSEEDIVVAAGHPDVVPLQWRNRFIAGAQWMRDELIKRGIAG